MVEEAWNGNERQRAAAEAPVWRYREALLRYARGIMRLERDDAADLVQSTFARFFGSGAVEARDLRRYLTTILHNLAIDRHRARRESAVEAGFFEALADERPSTEEQILHRQRLVALKRIIETLPARQRRAFVLSRLHGLTLAEIAADMAISVEGVKKHLSRACLACAHAMQRFDAGEAP